MVFCCKSETHQDDVEKLKRDLQTVMSSLAGRSEMRSILNFRKLSEPSKVKIEKLAKTEVLHELHQKLVATNHVD
jgi:hypothetical protein